MKKLFLIATIVLAFFLRTYRIENPLADWHSWRQADTSSVSRNFLKYGFDLLHPRTLPQVRIIPRAIALLNFLFIIFFKLFCCRPSLKKALNGGEEWFQFYLLWSRFSFFI